MFPFHSFMFVVLQVVFLSYIIYILNVLPRVSTDQIAGQPHLLDSVTFRMTRQKEIIV